MHFLATRLGAFLVDAVLDWIADQVADEVKKQKFIFRHKAGWEKLTKKLAAAQTVDERIEATRDIARGSF